MSPIFATNREENKNPVGFNLQIMREEVQSAAEALISNGDENVHYVSGLDIFGSEYIELLPDDVHPDAEGYRVMGKNFATKVASKYFVES